MRIRQTAALKGLSIFLLVFTPYFAALVFVVINPPANMRPFALLALIYMVLGIWTCVVLTRKIFNKQLTTLSPEEIERSQNTYGLTNFPPLTMNIAYVSSVAHLEKFQALPWYAKQMGFGLGDFPMVTAGNRSLPIVYFACGELSLTLTELGFTPASPGGWLKTYSNLQTDLRFTFSPGEILSVSRFDMGEVTSAAVRLPFLRVVATCEPRDFLVCSGSDVLTEVASQTEDLFVALGSFMANGKNA